MQDDYCSYTENVVEEEDLVDVCEALGVDVDSDNSDKGAEEVDKAVGPPDLQDVSESNIHFDQV